MSTNEEIAKNAEADLNTYQAKTGRARQTGLDGDAGVNTMAEKKFPSAELAYGENVNTNAGDSRPIPPSEGGAVDDKGRQATAGDYEGMGGPIDKIEGKEGGRNDNDVVPANVPKVESLGGVNDVSAKST